LAIDDTDTMSTQRLLLLLALIGAGCQSLGCATLSAKEVPDRSRTGLCDLLESVSPGDQIDVTVSGIYLASTVLYDPTERLCDIDIQTTTTVEFGTTQLDPEFKAIFDADRRVFVTLQGVLWGPPPLKNDDPALPLMVAYSRRIGGRRYGDLGMFRTKLVVERVLEFGRVPPDLPSIGESAIPRPESMFPVLIAAELPHYPPTAQLVGISGTVMAEVTVHEGEVVEVDVLSGDRILADAVLKNIQTWRFHPEVNAKFSTNFLFELEPRRSGGDRNTHLDLRLPSFARLNAAMNLR
jgi:TonB family protein